MWPINSLSEIMSLTTPYSKMTFQTCQLICPGLIKYSVAWEWQRSLVQQRRDCPELADVLILLEHPPVYTLGQGAKLDFLKFDPSQNEYEVYRVERGGEVTYHCPGQLVGYPILNLKHYQQDLHWYLRELEEVLLKVLDVYGLKGERYPGLTGVWLEDRKVGAIGIKVSRWITMHGFALNVSPNLEGFHRIVPCGIFDKSVGSLAQFIPRITIDEVVPLVANAFAKVFGVKLIKSTNSIYY